MLKQILNVNGVPTTIIVDPEATLADVLRSQLGLTGTKVGCGQGQCGACSVILNGKLVRSCVTSMKRVPAEASVTTVEGIGSPAAPHPIQQPGSHPRRRPQVVPGSQERLPVQRL